MTRRVGPGRRRDGPHRPARCVLRRHAGLPRRRRPRRTTLSVRAITDCRFFMLIRARTSPRRAHLVPDGDAPARGPVPRDAELAADRRPAAAPAAARYADRRADARAEQPGGAPRVRAERSAAGEFAAMRQQARHARARGDRPAAARAAGRRAGGGGAGRRDGAELTRDCRSPSARTSSATGSRITASSAPGSIAPIFVGAGTTPEFLEKLAGGAPPDCSTGWSVARVHAGDRAADRRGHRLRHPDHDLVGGRGEAVLPHGPRSRSSGPTSTSASRAPLTMLAASSNGTQGGQGLRPRPAAGAGLWREINQVWTNLIDNAVQAMDGAGHADDPTSLEATTSGSRSATPDRASPPSCGSGSSSRSSPPRPSARAPGWAWTSPTASSSPAMAATSPSSPSPATPASSSACR